MSDLHTRAQSYINYNEKIITEDVETNNASGN